MHITAYCPSCRSRYQLDPELRGQRMRCPNPVCREVFEVQDAEPKEAKSAEDGGEPVATPLAVEPNDGARQQQHLGESPTGTRQTTGSVGDLIPILDAEVVHEVPPPITASGSPPTAIAVHEAVPINPDQDEDAKPIPVDDFLPPPIEVENLVPLEPDEEEKAKPVQELPSWHVPPPVRNPNAGKTQSGSPEGARPYPAEQAEAPAEQPPRSRKSKSAPQMLPAVPAKLPEAAPPSWHSAPPIRRRGSQPFPEPEPSAAAPSMEVLGSQSFSREPPYDTRSATSRASRRSLWIIGAMVLVAGFIIATATVLTLNAYVQTEAKLYAQAASEYDEGKYASAANTYQNLVKDFPNSDHRSFYQLLAELSQVRDQVYAAQTDPGQALTAVDSFLDARKSDPLLKTYKPDIWQTLGKLAEQLAMSAKQKHDPALLAKAKKTIEQSKRYQPSDRAEPAGPRDLIAQAQADIDYWQKKKGLLERFGQWEHEPSVDAVKDARDFARRQGLEQDPDIKDRIAHMETAARLRVRYFPNEAGSAQAASEAVETSLLIVPPVTRPAKPPAEGKRAMLALARGVLYALDQGTGQELWATRVGIDTATLPVRLAATPASPELFLVLSADRNVIMALEALTGTLFWQHRLSAPSLGRPVVVGGRKAFVATYDGHVHEIETAKGYVMGHFELGQHLTVGGVWQEGTDLLYFPGDSDYLYVLDAALINQPNQPPRTKQCVAILHTGHPSGSLRSEPIVINRVDPFAKGDGAANTSSYLILAQTDGLEHMKLRVFGLPIDNSEARPLLQPEPPTLGWSWFQPYHDGERLAFATDAGIFGLFGINQVRNADKPLFPELEQRQKPAPTNARLVRAQVVHGAENDFWVLADGVLQRLHFDLFGQRMVPVWNAALTLGSPVHAAQVDESEKTIFVVTQDLTQPIYLATAVAAEDGTKKWQRQLGLECQSDPLVLGREVITVDRGGGLCIIDGSKYRHQEEREWRRTDPVFAAALPGGPITAHLLPGPDGTSVYEIACPASGGMLMVRRYQAGRVGDKPVLDEKSTVDSTLPPLAGTPAIVGQSLLLPLANGTIRRFPLPLTDGRGEDGPNWRVSRADDDARGHIVALGADEFLTTDGSRGLTHWQWPQNGTFQTLPPKKVPTVELPARIVAAPVVLPSANAGAEWQVCVADSEGSLTLLRGPDLKPEPPWSLRGKITAGPFQRGQYLGCVVERRRLVWIDPSRAEPLWEYTTPGEGIVGQPQFVGDLVVVADLSGRLIGLDPASGKARGAGYALKASAAPAATPVAFGPDAAFVPLTDGTVFLLALRHLRGPLAALPTFGP